MGPRVDLVLATAALLGVVTHGAALGPQIPLAEEERTLLPKPMTSLASLYIIIFIGTRIDINNINFS